MGRSGWVAQGWSAHLPGFSCTALPVARQHPRRPSPQTAPHAPQPHLPTSPPCSRRVEYAQLHLLLAAPVMLLPPRPLAAGEWYMRNSHFPGWGRPYEFNSQLMARVGRGEEARDVVRAGWDTRWGGRAGGRADGTSGWHGSGKTGGREGSAWRGTTRCLEGLEEGAAKRAGDGQAGRQAGRGCCWVPAAVHCTSFPCPCYSLLHSLQSRITLRRLTHLCTAGPCTPCPLRSHALHRRPASCCACPWWSFAADSVHPMPMLHAPCCAVQARIMLRMPWWSFPLTHAHAARAMPCCAVQARIALRMPWWSFADGFAGMCDAAGMSGGMAEVGERARAQAQRGWRGGAGGAQPPGPAGDGVVARAGPSCRVWEVWALQEAWAVKTWGCGKTGAAGRLGCGRLGVGALDMGVLGCLPSRPGWPEGQTACWGRS